MTKIERPLQYSYLPIQSAVPTPGRLVVKTCCVRVLLFALFIGIVKFSWSALQPEAFDLDTAYNGNAEVAEYVINSLIVLAGAIIAATSYDPCE